MKHGYIAAVAALTVSGCTQPRAKQPTIEVEAVRAADELLQKAVAANDLETIVSFYADDAVLMPAAGPSITGKSAIKKEWAHILAIPDLENTSKLVRVEASSANDLAYTMGTYQSQMMGEDGNG